MDGSSNNNDEKKGTKRSSEEVVGLSDNDGENQEPSSKKTDE